MYEQESTKVENLIDINGKNAQSSSSTINHAGGFYVFDIVFETSKNIDITTSGYGGNAFQLHIVTNCNAYTGFNSDYNGANNYMLSLIHI